jgi:hypothetical protein
MAADRYERRHRRTARNVNCIEVMANADFATVPSLSEAMGLEEPATTAPAAMHTPEKIMALDGQAQNHVAQSFGVLGEVYADVDRAIADGRLVNFGAFVAARVLTKQAAEQAASAAGKAAAQKRSRAQEEYLADLPKYTTEDLAWEYRQAKAAGRDFNVRALTAEAQRRAVLGLPVPATMMSGG